MDRHKQTVTGKSIRAQALLGELGGTFRCRAQREGVRDNGTNASSWFAKTSCLSSWNENMQVCVRWSARCFAARD